MSIKILVACAAALAFVAFIVLVPGEDKSTSEEISEKRVEAEVETSEAIPEQPAMEMQEMPLESLGYAVGDQVLGHPDAPVTLMEYASLTCPHCASFHRHILPSLKKDYIDTGKVKMIFREVYFDKFGLWAGMVARCGGPEKYFGYIDLFMRQQDKWTQADNIAEDIRRIGRIGGLSNERLNACMTSQTLKINMVEAYQANAARDNIQATPTVFINGTKVENPSVSALTAAIEAALPE